MKTCSFILLLFVMLAGCSGKSNQQKNTDPVLSEEKTTLSKNAIFNGKSLDGWEITSFGTEGPVLVTDDKIILNFGDGCTGVTYLGEFPKVNYEVTLDARKTSGSDFFCGMTFPVNGDFCSLIVGGWGGPVVGLSCIDGNDANHNDTKILKNFEKDVWYKIRLKVTSENISAWIDNEKLVDFNYSGSKLHVRPEVELSKPFGICSWNTTAELKNIQLEMF